MITDEILEEMTSPSIRFWTVIVMLLVSAIGYAFIIFSYAHGAFMTIREADSMTKSLDRIEQKLDAFLLEKIKEK